MNRIVRNQKLLAVFAVLLVLPILGGQTNYQRSRRGATPKSMPTGAYKELAGTFHGTLKELSNKEIVIQSDENQTVSIRRSGPAWPGPASWQRGCPNPWAAPGSACWSSARS